MDIYMNCNIGVLTRRYGRCSDYCLAGTGCKGHRPPGGGSCLTLSRLFWRHCYLFSTPSQKNL